MKLSNIVQNLDVKVPPNFNLDIEITKLNTLQDGKEGELSFLYNDNYLSQIQNSKVSAIIIKKEYLSKLKKETIPLIAENPYIELAKATKFFNLPFENKNRGKTIINQSSYIDTSSHIGNNVIIDEHVQIFANCYIGDNVKIGKNSIIYPNVIIYKDTIIGKDVIIHSGTVVGSDGFGFATNNKGEHIKIYQNGYVEIEDKVEIGANSTIDRAVFNKTIIRNGTKIDNLVQIGHNCDIGENSILVSQCGIAGSTEIGRNSVIGGQSGIAGHLKIAPFTTITAKAGVSKNIKESGKYWSGFPLVEHRKWLKFQAKLASFMKLRSF